MQTCIRVCSKSGTLLIARIDNLERALLQPGIKIQDIIPRNPKDMPCTLSGYLPDQIFTNIGSILLHG
jgi:hypothetical protein